MNGNYKTTHQSIDTRHIHVPTSDISARAAEAIIGSTRCDVLRQTCELETIYGNKIGFADFSEDLAQELLDTLTQELTEKQIRRITNIGKDNGEYRITHFSITNDTLVKDWKDRKKI